MDSETLALETQSRSSQYWLSQFANGVTRGVIPYDNPIRHLDLRVSDHFTFQYDYLTSRQLIKLGKSADVRLQTLLTAITVVLITKYTGLEEIVLASPIHRQIEKGRFINTIFPLRTTITSKSTFKNLVLSLRETTSKAMKHQDISMEDLVENLGLTNDQGENPLFDIGVELKNGDEGEWLRQLHLSLLFVFEQIEDSIAGQMVYDSNRYANSTINRMVRHLTHLSKILAFNVDTPLDEIDILTAEDRRCLLGDFDGQKAPLESDQALHHLIEYQAKKTPGRIAVICGDESVSYEELNTRADRLARYLIASGAEEESVIGVMLERSVNMVVALLAILKTGAAYLPIEVGYPESRVIYMMENAGSKLLITNRTSLKNYSFSRLGGFEESQSLDLVRTASRPHIADLDSLPMPDRSLISMKNYRDKIGMASVSNCISFLTTRGCPYQCLYCHKIWSKNHAYRSATNILEEISYYASQGVCNFAVIDDCFNLNGRNSRRLLEMIIRKRLDIQLFFPNGLRGDLLTPDYIDLMVEAGTRGINLSLETASPRLQELLKKRLNLEKFKSAIEHIAMHHKNVILELATMHGFPTETEEEAMTTLQFIKDIHWIHFPYIHILKIFPNTEMEAFALENGVSKSDILASRDRAFHELPDTLPFPKSFTKKYQADFMNEYFLNRDRLRQVLPIQMNILDQNAIVQKYNAYLPAPIKTVQDILEFAGISDLRLTLSKEESVGCPDIFRMDLQPRPVVRNTRRILFLDLSQYFSDHEMLYKVVEQPLGLISLLSYLKGRFGPEIDGRIYKSGNDFDSFEELREIVNAYRPELVAIRTLTFLRDFFHETVSLLRQWGVSVPIITGGPYASSEFDLLLKDSNVDLAVLGEGEQTLGELVEVMLKNDFNLPDYDVLSAIKGLAFIKATTVDRFKDSSRQILLMDLQEGNLTEENPLYTRPRTTGRNLAYVMYTSGTTGNPKGVMVEHTQVLNCIRWMQSKFQIKPESVVIGRTNLTFDPSVWEIFWPLQQGATLRLLTDQQSKDPEFLIDLMTEGHRYEIMYCPASLFTAMSQCLDNRRTPPLLTLPNLLIGAEPVDPHIVGTFYQHYSGKITNTYGPTECTINNTYFDLTPENTGSRVPIGKPVANNSVYVTSSKLALVPLGMPGEICIAGSSVARGYINDPERTDANFPINPFGPGRIYRTGDIGRWREDGNLEILGRKDDQIKLRGYRIEPSEIESVLAQHKAVKECIVVAKHHAGWSSCSQCGISSNYPEVQLNEEGKCAICSGQHRHEQHARDYFLGLHDLKMLAQGLNSDRNGPYDCILMFAGGRGAGYALYQLVEMGLKVLTLTYDNGYLSKSRLDGIRQVTSDLGVDNVIVAHPNAKRIMAVSGELTDTLCLGCAHTSNTFALKHAWEHNIPLVVGATLSRGQIIESRLMMLFKQGFNKRSELEGEIRNLRRRVPELGRPIFEAIDVPIVWDHKAYDAVRYVDFYRYCEVTNDEMISYLNRKHDYWSAQKTAVVYSTNCAAKQFSDFLHLNQKGYHYYGAATFWERRLGHLSLEEALIDLECTVTQQNAENFFKRLGCRKSIMDRQKTDGFLSAYWVSDQEIEEQELRQHLRKHLPEYMVPSYFTRLKSIPINSSGKIDRKRLPDPQQGFDRTKEYVAPRNETEKALVAIWQDILRTSRVGVHDSFFDLGGNSLLTVRMIGRIQQELGVDINLASLFSMPTIAALARLIDKSGLVAEEGGDDNITLALKDAQVDIPIGGYRAEATIDRPQHVLLTGATGFVGFHILEQLLFLTDARIHCLVRGAGQDAMRGKFRDALHFYGRLDLEESPRIILLNGDMKEPALGLPAETVEDLSDIIDHIWHCGAFVHHMFDYGTLRRENVQSTVELLKIASSGRRKVFNFVSTIMAASRRDNQGRTIEVDLGDRPISSNGYILTKWASERILLSHAAKGLLVNIFRPGNATGHSATGICPPEKNHALLLMKGCIQMRCAPDWQRFIEMTPVDTLAEALVQLSLNSQRSDMFNLNNPLEMGWEEYVEELRKLGFHIEMVSVDQWRKRLESIDEMNALFPLREFYLKETKDLIDPESHAPTAQDASKTQAILREFGVSYLRDYTGYIPTLIGYLKGTGFLPTGEE
jgi:amino acid adenylation domain-containing protein/thioester reductase-like protein